MPTLIPIIVWLAAAQANPLDTGEAVSCDGLSPVHESDQDGDGLLDEVELHCESDPCHPDTDLDGTWDGDEVTGPLECGPDSDEDGIPDLLDPDSPATTAQDIAPAEEVYGLSGGRYTGGACSVGAAAPAMLPALLIFGALLGRRRWPLALASVAASTAHAVDVQRLQPSLEDSSFVSLRDAALGPAGFGAGMLSHYARSPLQLRHDQGVQAIVSDLWTTDTALIWTHQAFSVGAALPVHGWVAGQDAAEPRWLGDARMSAKVGLYGTPDGPVMVSGIGHLGLPTGSSDGWLGAPGTSGSSHIAVSGGQSARWTLNLGGLWIPRTDLGDLTMGSALSWRAGGSLPLTESLSVSAELDGANQLIQSSAEGAHPVELISAARLKPTEHLSLRLGGGAGLSPGAGVPLYRALLGLSWMPSAPQAPIEPPTSAPAEPSTQPPEPAPPEPESEPEPDTARSLLEAPVRFTPGGVELSLGAQARLKEVALVLLDHPELGQIELQGRASGEPDQAKPLSLARAEAVMVWLVDNGVSAQRLSARGYGSSLPTIVQTTDARDQVDIHILAPQSE